MVFLRINPKRSSLLLGKYKKLRARYSEPYQITQKINDRVYRLDLPNHLKVHNVFHVSLLKQYIPEPNHILDDETIIAANDAIQPQEILQTRIRTLRNREIKEHIVK